MSDRTFKYGGIDSSNYGIIIDSISIPRAKKKRYTVDVPFANGSYDFSPDAQYYENRQGTIVFEVLYDEKIQLPRTYSDDERLQSVKDVIANWLLKGGKREFVDSDNPGVTYFAEIVALEEVDDYLSCTFTATIEAEPFVVKVSKYSGYTSSFTGPIEFFVKNIDSSEKSKITITCSSDNEYTYQIKDVYGVPVVSASIGGEIKTKTHSLPNGTYKLMANGTYMTIEVEVKCL